MATKRYAAVDPTSGTGPPPKKLSLTMPPLDIGPASGEDDLDLKVLQVQNRKLSERLRERNRHQEQLEVQIDKMEQIQENNLKLHVSLKQQFMLVREHLLVVMAGMGCEEMVLEEEEVDTMMQGGSSDKVIQSFLKCVEKLSKTECGEKCRNSPNPRVLALLDEMSRRQNGEVEYRELQESYAVVDAKCEQLQEDLANARFSLEQSQTRGDRLEARLEATLKELRSRPVLRQQSSEECLTQSAEDRPEGSTASTTAAVGDRGPTALEDKTEEIESLQDELLEAREVANHREEEMAQLSAQLAEARKEADRLKVEQQQIPESVVKDSAVYKSLHSQFSIAALETAQFRSCLDEAKALLQSARQQHFSQLEEIRAEEVKYQIEVREEMTLLENALAAVKRDYEVLRIEFERNVASNEQAGPIAKELRVTVESLQKTISQLKSEVNRYKVRAHKAEQQIAKEKEREGKEKTGVSGNRDTSTDPAKVESIDPCAKRSVEEDDQDKTKAQLKSMELELESYREASSVESRDKADLITAEKKARAQVEELKKRFEDFRRDYEKRKEHIREEAARKTKSLTEDNRHLQKDLSAKKHEAQALVSEMECTAEAFEEMQEQNLRLLQQLKEKDDANFKLMSERIKSNSMYKLLSEEKQLLHVQLKGLQAEKHSHLELVGHFEERGRITETTIQGLDRELILQQQANELHRRRAEESLQEVTHLQFQLGDRQKQVESIQVCLSGRTDEWEKEGQLHRKSMEEIIALKRKLEKYKSKEWMAAGDEVLLEEIKMYKAKLNCPCCSARKKDTVLTKCFHVFCSECIKNRYDSRLRKCPKCGAAFGANDFHKIYLA